MKIFSIFLLAIFVLSNDENSPFYQFNKDPFIRTKCQNPKFYIKTANHEESLPSNQNKIILYHGEGYGHWLFQLILKEFLYPEAPDDWLPLRFGKLDKEVDKTDLMQLIRKGFSSNDHHPDYTKIGLSVTPNLKGGCFCESAWGNAFQKGSWQKMSGYSLGEHLHKRLWRYIKENFVPEAYWKIFIKQKKLINQFIQIKRNQSPAYVIKDYPNQIKNNFPDTFRQYFDELKHLDYDQSQEHFLEGVLLQIIMDKDLADELVYDSYPFGWVKSEKNDFFRISGQGKEWTGQEIEPYSEKYLRVKHKDYESQARVAMNRDFREFPSRIRIKSIAGIMENPIDYKVLKSMIRELVVNINKMKKEAALENTNKKKSLEIIKKKKKYGLFSKFFFGFRKTTTDQ